jgi:UDP-glucose 4-epimerase
VSGISLNYEITERRKGDVPIVYASTDYAKDVLGWEAKRNLKEMIESAWKWEQNLRAQS